MDGYIVFHVFVDEICSNGKNKREKCLFFIRVEEVTQGLKVANVGSSENPFVLLACRGAGICDFDETNSTAISYWKKVDICDHHADELLRKWKSSHGFRDKHVIRDRTPIGWSEVCTMPKEIGEVHTVKPYQRLRPLSIKGSQAILEYQNLLVHPGLPICRDHQDYVESLITTHMPPPPKKPKVEPIEPVESEFEDEDDCREPVYHQPQGHCIDPLRRAFLDFARESKVTRVCSEKSWDELQKTTKARKASIAKQLIENMLGLMVPDKTDEFRKMVQNKFVEMEKWTTGTSEDLDIVMTQISAQYYASEDRNNRILILSLVANSVSYPKVEKYINGLTPTVMIGLPYGIRNVKMSDGSKIEIPNSIRQQSATEIIEMYSKVCQDNNRTDLILGTSTMYKILNVCAATKREASTCVDYYIATGMESFDGLHKILDNWKDLALFDSEKIDQMKRQLFEAAQYFRTDFRLHVKNFSRVADHCANFALSDPSDTLLSSSCSDTPHKHSHDLKCERCERANLILDIMKIYAEEFVDEQEKAVASTGSDQVGKMFLAEHKNEVEEIELFTKNIFAMKKHLLRAAYTNEERSAIISGLQDNEALITMDFAQKFLPKWHREKQQDYYGKKGISYHVSHITSRIGHEYVQHSFVHIYEGSVTQDSKLIILTLSHFLPELKKVGIQKVHLRSDNAGCYHSASTIGSLHWLMEKTKMHIETYTFSETQNGKSNSDRDANRVKRKVKEYISKGGDVTTSLDFFNALKENPLNGVSVYHGNVLVEEEGGTKWPGISNLNYFVVEKNGIRARRYGNIGSGIFVEKSSFKPINGSFIFSEAGHVASAVDPAKERTAVIEGKVTQFWYQPKCSSTGSCVKEPDPIIPTDEDTVTNNYIGDLYSCPEPGCSATYLKHSNLENHILKDQHHFVPEKITEIDYALHLYSRNLEEVRDTDNCPIIKDAVEKLKESSIDETLNVGWALQDKRIVKPFEQNVIKFLHECFNKGVQEKKPMNPVAVAGLMCTLKNDDGTPRFSVSERKTVPQISGYFKREADKLRHNTQAVATVPVTQPPSQKVADSKKARKSHHRRRRHGRVTKPAQLESYTEPENEHEHAGLISFIKSEEYWTSEDEYYNATLNNKEMATVLQDAPEP
ncbi:hypothetical protein CAEBREN_02494 [Caenorhabditis brenneri]|uniref:C2H2-type domain-containing protein n=1 Tax=Caenorhabditis brenneri TaxID=135651 RepID=G0NSU6_CAEBE|nr:hypothetical protein CAEBREN_02494 [Caenorhabditis brenneri]